MGTLRPISACASRFGPVRRVAVEPPRSSGTSDSYRPNPRLSLLVLYVLRQRRRVFVAMRSWFERLATEKSGASHGSMRVGPFVDCTAIAEARLARKRDRCSGSSGAAGVQVEAPHNRVVAVADGRLRVVPFLSLHPAMLPHGWRGENTNEWLPQRLGGLSGTLASVRSCLRAPWRVTKRTGALTSTWWW